MSSVSEGRVAHMTSVQYSRSPVPDIQEDVRGIRVVRGAISRNPWKRACELCQQFQSPSD